MANRETPVKIAGVPAEIRIRHIMNTSLQHDHDASLLGIKEPTWKHTSYVTTSRPSVFAVGFVYLKVANNYIIRILKPLIPTADLSQY